MPRLKILHLWVPGCAPSSGGVQAFSWNLFLALVQEFPETEIRVFSKHDTVAPEGWPSWANLYFHGAGGWPGLLRSAAFAARLVVAALRQRPDLILSTHVNFTPLARWLKHWRGIPYAAVAHGIDVWRLTRTSVIRGLREADTVFAVSRFTRDTLRQEQGLEEDRLRVLPNTIDGTHFKPGPKPDALLQRYGLRPDQPVILTVSRLAEEERYKGYDRILGILPELRKLLPGVHYLLAGKGQDAHRINGLIRDHGLQDCVTLTGFIPDWELADLYRLCDVFAMPSRKEGFGIVFLEAMATGKPVIAGNLDGSVDPLADGELGVLINPLDGKELLEALYQVLTGTHPLALLRDPEGLRQAVLERFGFPSFAKKVREEIGRLMGAET